MDWKNWCVGRKIIFVATVLAVLTMFMTWFNFVFVTISGFQTDAKWLLILFVYPIVILIKNKKYYKIVGIISGIVSFLVVYSSVSATFKRELGTGINSNFMGIGFYLFLLASLLLTVGSIMRKKDEVEIIN